MRGEAVEIAIERLHVDDAVRHGLRAVEQYGYLELLGARDEPLHRHDRAERVGDVREREQASARTDEALEGCEVHFAGLRDRNHLELRAGLLADELPRHDVGVVLQRRNQDLVAGLQPRSRVALRDQVDRFGRAADEDDLAASSVR